MVKSTNKKGKVTLSFTNIEWQYQLRIEKEGYQTPDRDFALPPRRPLGFRLTGGFFFVRVRHQVWLGKFSVLRFLFSL